MKRHLIESGATIMEALEAINRLSGETMTLFVAGPDSILLGSLTDGDIRRALLAGRTLSDKAEDICRRDCLRIEEGNPDVAIIAEARRRGISLLPVVDRGRITSVFDLRKQRGLLPVDAVLMAGGAGERLRPLTATVPKPLLPVNGTPIIELNIDLLRRFGISDITVSVNYLKDKIKSRLEATCPDVKFIEEPRKLGTIGSLGLIQTHPYPHTLVMNADLLTDINLEAMYLRHIDTEAWLTVAVVPYSVSVPFAIIEHQGDAVKGLTEKPTFNYYANAGIYLLNRAAVDMVAEGEYMDATELIDRIIARGCRVSLYLIEGKWLDIGSPDDYRRACGE